MKFYVCDTETTGVKADAQVVEVAILEVDEDLNVVGTLRSLINPGCHIPAVTSALHGIVDADVVNAPTLDEFLDGFRFAAAEDDACFVAHNSEFDLRFLRPYFITLAGSICTMRMARAHILDSENHKLQTLKYHLELPVSVAHHEAHTALADCKVTLELLRWLKDNTGLTLDEMMHFCGQREVITKWPFGKYKNKPLNHDKRYARWMLNNADSLSDDLRSALLEVVR